MALGDLDLLEDEAQVAGVTVKPWPAGATGGAGRRPARQRRDTEQAELGDEQQHGGDGSDPVQRPQRLPATPRPGPSVDRNMEDPLRCISM